MLNSVRKLQCGFLAVLMLVGAVCQNAVAQEKQLTVSGIVIDNDGLPLVGVVVMVTGNKTSGTMTDVDGSYSISIEEGQLLEFNCLGYETEKIKPQSSRLNVTMHPDAIQLDEAAVVGYGEVKKQTLTGAISAVSSDELLRTPKPNVGNMLMGNVTGLTTISTSSTPGNDNPEIFVRGIATLNPANSTPLMLVDGVERDFFQLDPNEIESISVLKDASATAVFGVQGANGVIIVTTKRGQEGKPKISVSLSGGVQTPIRLMKMADSYEYGIAYNEMMGEEIFTPEMLEAFRTGSDSFIYPSHDWLKEFTNKYSLQTQNNINISGGTDRMKYFASVGYLYQDGIFKKMSTRFQDNFTYNRINYRANFDIKVTGTTDFSISLGGIVGMRQSPNVDETAMWHTINMGVPYASAGVVDDKLILSNSYYYPKTLVVASPFDQWYGKGKRNINTNSLSMDLSLKQDLGLILDGLSAKAKVSYNSLYGFQKNRTYNIPTYTPWRIGDTLGWENIDPNADPNEVVFVKNGEDALWGYNESFTSKSRRSYAEVSLDYAQQFGKHNVSALLLGNMKKTFYLPAGKYNYPEIPLGSLGLVGRVTYNYAQKYLFEFNVGYNGSENFAKGKRFGFFPAVSLGWVLSEEKFIKDNIPFISFLKLRASVGKVGSDFVGKNRFLYVANQWNPNSGGYVFGSYNEHTKYPGASENKFNNPDVTWETAVKQNYGIDISVLDGRLGLNAEIFFEDRTNILSERHTVPDILGQSFPVENIGEVKNHGWELMLKWQDSFARKNGRYWLNATTSFNRSEIVYMDEIRYDVPWRQRTGNPVGQYFGYVYERLYNSSDFPEANKYGSFLAPGDMKFTDLNNDGVIDGNDEKPVGYTRYPEYVFSLNMGISYKGFDFSMLWQGATHVSKKYSMLYRMPFAEQGTKGLVYAIYENRYISEEKTPDATWPRLANEARDWNYNNVNDNSFWIKDASYLRLKNAEIGYNIKGKNLKKAGLSSVRIYLNGSNLLTFDYLKYFDPEEKTGEGNFGDYPNMAVVNLGVNLNF